MADTSLYIKNASGDLVPVDVRTTPDGDRRQVFLVGDGETANLISPATEDTLAAILTELGQKIEAGQAIALDGPTLAALEQITVSNPPDLTGLALDATLSGAVGGPGSSPPTLPGSGSGLLGYLRAVRDLLAGTLTVGGTITPTAAGDVAGTLTDGRKTVTTAGTAVAIRASLACKWVQVTALTSNTQQVNVGAGGVLAAAGTSTGTPLAAGQSTTIPVDNASKVFVDARVAGEGVSFTVGS